ncbi:PKD domain-containing protein [Pseudarthrobacter sp. LT1]|uniref:PKD domain-containing protein n=1 Tax=Pseudarthrobacter sp. LT1 TaxID=3111450 RepID=UPI002D799CDA|nr:PKD domain-containing protein [Pseudarthrobacter sp. LT1]WRT13877.1 PKD domain-containing protein [Pseudarthrobacter sp. LT1]
MKLRRRHFFSRTGEALAVAMVLAASILGLPGTAVADPVYGTQSIAYSGVSNPPTSDKPQSKLWWNDGSWWADMWKSGTGWSIYRLDRASNSWVDTGVVNDTRGSTLADTMWDGSHLYIASHVVTITGDGTPKPSLSKSPAKLYRYSYAGGKYTLDSGFPTTITNNSSESMTIDKDTTGRVWATWTQVAGNSTSGYTNTVYMNAATNSGASWGTPFVLPVSNPNPAPDDISAVVAFGNGQVGVMWSDHKSDTVWWATHKDSDAANSSWKLQPALRGNGQSDDHMNLKTLQADTSGRVFAAVKTSLNDISSDKTLPQLILLVFKPGTGAFTQSTIAKTGDCVSRPQIILDTQNNLVRAFHTAPPTSVSGCAYSGVAGSIYEKTASMDNPVFGSGRGTPIMQAASSSNINDVTTSKQSVNNTTGLVVMASDNVAKRYWFSDRSLGGTPPPAAQAPVASFTASPTSGAAPLNVTFTDTSTNAPTSWAWTFGDGGTSTAQNPSHSFTTAGTYTAKLTATNAAGSSSATATITVGSAPPPATGGITVVNSSTSNSGTAVTTASLTVPAGTAAGDVLVASITTDLNPNLTAPAGWTAMVNAKSINSTSTSGARAFAYYKVVGASDPGTYSWALSSAAKWGGGITSYRGVNNATPLDSPVVTAADTSYSATSITVGSITTASNGAMLIGGVACDCSAPVVTAPSGWTERWEAAAGQIAEQADKPQATAGASGTATWTLSAARAVAAWRAALKPAA